MYEEDAYGVKTKYTYDEYGNLIKEELIGAKGTKGAYKEYVYDVEPGRIVSQEGGRNVIAYGTTGQYLVSAGGAKTGEFFDYLTPHGVVNKVYETSKGSYHAPTGVAESSTFDSFKEKVTELKQSVSDAQKGKITVTYENGQVRTVGNGAVTYGAKYDLVNDKAEYTLFDGGTETTLETLQKTSNSNHHDTITKRCYRTKDETPDRMGTEYDSYERIVSIDENGFGVSHFVYSRGDESDMAQRVTLMGDTHRDRYDESGLLAFAMQYDYDPDWNLIGWHETYGLDKIPGLSVRQINAGETKYTFPDGEKNFAAIGYDESVLIQPRLNVTKIYQDVNGDDDDGEKKVLTQYTRNYSYDEFGRVVQKRTDIDELNDHIYTIEYNDASTSLMKSYTYKLNTGALSEEKIEVKNTYGYDERGNLTSQTEEKTTSLRENYAKNFVHQKSYSYDSLNRLKSEKVQTPIAIPEEDYFLIDRTYDYYADGRLHTIKEGTTTREFQYDAHGRLIDAGGVSYTYDNYGNRLTKTKNGERISYSYTRGNILANANGAEYSYDTAGVRFRKKYNGVTTEYYLDGRKILGEDRTDANGAITKLRYFYDATGLCGVKCTKDGKSSYYSYICDAQGNVVMIVEGSTPLVRYEYDVWGNCRIYTYAKYYPEVVLDCSIGEINPFRWKSHYFDTESGLYYIEGNYYDPETGRYLNACSVSTIIDNPFSDYTLDRNGIMCDNILELLPYMYAIYTSQELSPDPTYDPDANKSWWDWLAFGKGIGYLITGISAIIVAAFVLASGVALTPMLAIAIATIIAGGLTTINGLAEVVEAGTGYHFIKDTVFQGNSTAYNIYSTITSSLATIGTMICGGWLKANQPRIQAYKNIDSYSRTRTVANHTDRAYNDSILLQKQIIKYGKMTKDLRSKIGYVFTAPGSYNQSVKFWRLVLSNSEKIILHFGFGS